MALTKAERFAALDHLLLWLEAGKEKPPSLTEVGKRFSVTKPTILRWRRDEQLLAAWAADRGGLNVPELIARYMNASGATTRREPAKTKSGKPPSPRTPAPAPSPEADDDDPPPFRSGLVDPDGAAGFIAEWAQDQLGKEVDGRAILDELLRQAERGQTLEATFGAALVPVAYLPKWQQIAKSHAGAMALFTLLEQATFRFRGRILDRVADGRQNAQHGLKAIAALDSRYGSGAAKGTAAGPVEMRPPYADKPVGELVDGIIRIFAPCAPDEAARRGFEATMRAAETRLREQEKLEAAV